MSQQTPPPTEEARASTNKLALLVGLIVAVVAFQLNATMLNPAVQQIQDELGASVDQVAFTTAFFFLSKAIFQVFMPRLSDMWGRRAILLVSLAVLAVGTVIAMAAPSIEWLYVGRLLQGACGPVFSIALLVLREAASSEEEYGTKMGLVIAINGGVAGIDVLLGGWMADHWGFRSILGFTLVITVVAFFMARVWIPESAPSKGAQMDWTGVILLSVFVVALSYAVGADPFHKGITLWSAVYAAIGLAALLLFVLWERRAAVTLIPRAELGNRAIWAMPLTTVLTLCGVMAVVNLIVPSFAQNPTAGLGMSAAESSFLFMSPYALVGWIVGPFAGRLAPTFGYRTLLRFGLGCSAAVVAAVGLVGLHNKWVLAVLLIVLGITYAGVVNVMLNGLGITLSPQSAPGLLPGLNGASFGIGASLSFTILGQIVANGSPAGSPSWFGYGAALYVGAAILVAALLVSLVLPAPRRVERS